MALARREVHEPPLREQVHLLPALQGVLVDELPHPALLPEALEVRLAHLVVEMARVREDAAVLDRAEVLLPHDVLHPRRGDDEVGALHGLRHRHHAEPVHRRLDRLHGVDLRDDDVRPEAVGPRRDPATAPAVPRDDERLPRDQEVRRGHDPVHRGLPRAVAVVEEVLHLRVVHVHDGELELPRLLHRPEPDDPRRRLLIRAPDLLQEVPALRVEEVHEVRAVVDHDVRLEVEDAVQVLVVLLRRLPLLRERLETELLVQGRRDRVVRGEGVARGEADLRPRLF